MLRNCLVTATSIGLLLGCGGQSVVQDGGVSDGGATDAEASVLTQCESSRGPRVCAGPNSCSFGDNGCANCWRGGTLDGLGLCQSAKGPLQYTVNQCIAAPDGMICIAPDPTNPTTFTVIGDIDWGLLFLKNGAGDRVRYADMSLFTGDPLPTPTSCDSGVTAVKTCGGHCGGCGADEICHGRSPLHPFGICVKVNDGGPCTSKKFKCATGSSCFVWTVQPSAQADADGAGYCFPTAQCDNLAATLPGGGKCVTL
jgi:hypothetical protein